jgi:autonomous glycyl radical cofactor GrcA
MGIIIIHISNPTPMADGKEYVVQAQAILKRLNEINSDEQKWQFVVTKEGTSLYKKTYDNCPTPCYLTQTTIAKSKDALLNNIWVMDEKKAKVNDPKLSMWTEVEKGQGWKVCSQHNEMGWPIWPRHIVFAQVRFDDGNVTHLVAFSVKHKKAPVDVATHVEAKLHMSVYRFEQNKDGTTTINRYAQLDPCGNIPIWLVNMYAANQVDMFNRWRAQ